MLLLELCNDFEVALLEADNKNAVDEGKLLELVACEPVVGFVWLISIYLKILCFNKISQDSLHILLFGVISCFLL